MATPSNPEPPINGDCSRELSDQALAAAFAESGSVELPDGLRPFPPEEPCQCVLPESIGPDGRYRLREEIARGGMGVTYRVHDTVLGRDLAAKVLKQEHQDNAAVVARFWMEPQITGRLQHPNVPAIHDSGRLPDGRPYFIMRLVEGKTFAEGLARRTGPGQDLPRFLK